MTDAPSRAPAPESPAPHDVPEVRLDRPIFVAGAGRSGTTLLRSLLSAHPRISIAPETHYMRRVENWGGFAAGGPEEFDTFWDRFVKSVRFRDLGVEPARCLELIDRQPTRSFEAIFVAVLRAYQERQGAERVGEKTPSHARFILELLEWFPDAKFVVIQRDPRAVIASKLRTPHVSARISRPSVTNGLMVGGRTDQLVTQLDEWRAIYEEILPRWEHHPSVHLVLYEDLVTGTEEQLRRICAFLGEEFSSEMLTRRGESAASPPAAAWGDEAMDRWREEHHAKTLEAVSPASIDAWRDQLSAVDVAVIEGVCEDGMRSAGYPMLCSPRRRTAGRLLARGTQLAVQTEARARRVAGTALGPLRRARRSATG